MSKGRADRRIDRENFIDRLNYEEFQSEKKSILNEIAVEKEKEAQRKKQQLKEIIELTTYKKGEKKKKEVYLPMPTHHKVLTNKNINIKTYGAIMLESNFGGNFLNDCDRYIYTDKLDKVVSEVAQDLKISTRTLKTHISKLKKCDIKILEPCITPKGDLFYKLNYAHDYKNYILIRDKALRKLVNAYNENALRIYLILLYKCFNNFDNDTINYKEVELTQEYLCEKIGLKNSSRKVLTDCVEALVCGGFIKVRLEYKTNYENKSGGILNYPISKYYYSLSNDYLKSKIKKINKNEKS